MTHTVAPENIQEHEKKLDELIQIVGMYDNCPLLQEHLQSARTYVLGAMPLEYVASLEDARESTRQIHHRILRESLRDAIDHLLTGTQSELPLSDKPHHAVEKPHGSVPHNARSLLWAYLSTADVSFGVFYPKRHVILTFPSFEAATAAATQLRSAGFGPNECVAVRGEEMLLFLEELTQHLGVWGRLMRGLSEFFGTEGVFARRDEENAALGAGFLAVYCPSERELERVKALAAPFGPITLQHYTATGIVQA